MFAAFGKSQPTISEDTLKEKQANITGEAFESIKKKSEGLLSATKMLT